VEDEGLRLEKPNKFVETVIRPKIKIDVEKMGANLLR
jgi:hypothetical protein